MNWRQITTALVVSGLSAAVMGCAGQEMTDEEPEAVAQSPAVDDEALESASLKHETLPPGHESGSAGPSGFLADGHCGGQYQTTFSVERANLILRACCDGERACRVNVYFDEDDTVLAIEDLQVEPADFSPDGKWWVVSTEASTEEGGQGDIMVVSVEKLAKMAGPIEENAQLHTMDDLREMANWELNAGQLHGIEGLSARAVEEGQKECSEGYHLPTLIEISEMGTALSDRLDVEFSRWASASELVFSTSDGGESRTVMILDQYSQCMSRYSFTESPEPIEVDVIIEERSNWKDVSAERFDDQAGKTVTVVRGYIIDARAAGDVEAIVFNGDDSLDLSSVAVAGRHISTGEIDWWRRDDKSFDILVSEHLEAPAEQDGDHWHSPITIVVEGDHRDLRIELFQEE